QRESARLDEIEAEPLVELVGAGVGFFGVEDDLPDTLTLEIVNRFGHQAGADALAPDTRVGGNAYEVANTHIHNIELVACYPLLIFGDDEVWIHPRNLNEGARVVAPRRIEAESLHLYQFGGVTRAERANVDALRACAGDTVIGFVVG